MMETFGFNSATRNNSLVAPMTTFSTYHLLRNCNYFLNQEPTLKSLREVPTVESNAVNVAADDIHLLTAIEPEKPCVNLVPTTIFAPSTLLPYSHSFRLLQHEKSGYPISNNITSNTLGNCGIKKQRSEKKPIPNEQKDDKYFERRRRNNQAAKKSRDARKMREDQIALKATILEHENAILRAQVLTLREEASSLRQLLLQRKVFELPSRDQVCSNLNLTT